MDTLGALRFLLLSTPPAQPPKTGATGSGAGLAGQQMLHAASQSIRICSWNKWLGGGAMPAPSHCARGGFYEPWEEALVKVWDLRGLSVAKPAVLCNVM